MSSTVAADRRPAPRSLDLGSNPAAATARRRVCGSGAHRRRRAVRAARVRVPPAADERSSRHPGVLAAAVLVPGPRARGRAHPAVEPQRDARLPVRRRPAERMAVRAADGSCSRPCRPGAAIRALIVFNPMLAGARPLRGSCARSRSPGWPPPSAGCASAMLMSTSDLAIGLPFAGFLGVDDDRPGRRVRLSAGRSMVAAARHGWRCRRSRGRRWRART